MDNPITCHAPLGRLLAIALAVLISSFAPRPVAAVEPEFFERPFAQGQWTIGRRLDESQLRYCVDSRDPDWEVAGAIGDAIAAGLLLEPQRFVVESSINIEDITKVYGILLEDCDVYMGFKLIPGGYSEWATLSRSYYEAEYVFVTRDPEIQSLSALEPGRPIGATLGTMAHIRLVSYVSALPAQDRWPVFPMGTNDLALQSLANGTVDVAVVWSPALWARQASDETLADVRVIDPNPLPPTRLGVGALMLANQTFLRTALDEAITALSADGTIADILESYGFPASAEP